MKNKRIKKISRTRGFIRWTNLYSLDNHLLVENVGGYLAEYRRFFYEDIISIITYKNPTWKFRVLFDMIFAALGFLIFLNIFISHSPMPNMMLIIIFTSPLWIFPMIDLILGPTSKGQIRTITSTEDIPLASRYRKSQKVLQKIQRLIEERQGIIDYESIYGKSLEYKTPRFISPAKVSQDDKEERKIPTTKYSPLYSFFLIVLFFEVIVSSYQLKSPGNIATLLSSFSVFVFIVNVIVLFKQKKLYIRKPLQLLSWISFAVFISSLVAAFFLSIIIIFEYGLMGEAQYMSITQADHRFFLMRLIYLTLECLLVASGAVLSLKGHHSIYTAS